MQAFKVNCVLISSILLWASAFVGIKLALLSYTPGSLALLRFLIASFCMAILYKNQTNEPRMPWRERIQLMIVGMAGIGIYNICLNYGELSVSAGIASFIIGLMPIFTVLLSLIFLRERMNLGTWAGIFFSMLGLSLLSLGEDSQEGVTQGILFILISSLVGAIQTIMKKRFLKKYSSIRVISWVIWGGTVLLLIYLPSLINELPHASYQSTAVVIYMGIFPAAVAYSAWTYVLKKIPAAKASTSLYTLPFASTLLGYFFLAEQPSTLSLIGGAIALFGAIIAHHFQNKILLSTEIDKKVVAV
ncbi:DMT family transporter [Legionella sp. km772]|uniref:DMT family transporter n=1 Tax=Legionella sp. km772 TaxID=2498111 RepID=UPI000F8F7CD2|nr:EamA family transporter [Legionella sp. km772]RUR05943.1 EamA/RhaT family transporter [Legionella sp. km772]